MAALAAGYSGSTVPLAQNAKFCLLGPLLVRIGGTVVPVPAAKQRVVLAALLLSANRVVTLAELSEAVWGAQPPASARPTLQNYVKRLRQAIASPGPPRITTEPDGYRICAAAAELDLTRFQHLHHTACQAARRGDLHTAATTLREALALWRGQPLADIPSDLLQLHEAPRLAELHTLALEARIDADLHLGRHREVITELQQLTTANPLRERPHELLMLALYHDGRQADALATYTHARTTLATELGIEPGPGLRDLHHRILTADPGTAPPGQATAPGSATVLHVPQAAAPQPAPIPALLPRQLPARVSHFAGRAAELGALTTLLEDTAQPAPHTTRAPAGGGTVLISAIGGTAGVGKTALALQFAHLVAGRFPDGQLYVNLRGFDPSGNPMTSAEALRMFLDTLQVSPEQIPAGLEAQAGLYRSILAGRRMLIVLDNATDAAQIRPLLPGGGGCLVVVTSRRQLTALAVSECAYSINLDVLTDAEAHELMGRRLGGDRLAAEPAAVAELTVLCARLPLALSIAAARAAVRPGFPLAALAADLRDARGRLDALDGGEAAANVRAVFSWSCDQLSPPAARMFQLLGLHPGPDITAPAAASLAGIDRDHARRALAELTAAGLLAEQAPGRYAFHDLLRAYAAEQAETTDDESQRRAAIHRAVDHYLHTARAADKLLYQVRLPIAVAEPPPATQPEPLTSHAQALAWFDAEHQVLLAIVNLAAANRLDAAAWQLPWTMETFFYRRGHWHDWAATQRAGLAAARRLGDKNALAHAHRGIACASIELRSFDAARRHLAEALRIRAEAGDLSGQGRLHLDLARASNRNGDHSDALHHDRLGLDLFRAAGDRAGEADALSEAGWDLDQLGHYDYALACCEQALERHAKLGNRHNMGSTWDSLGYAHLKLGHHAEAAACYRRAVAILDELGHRYHKAVTLAYAGDAYHAAGDTGDARDAWQRALAVLDGIRHPDAAQVRAKLRSLDAAGPPEGNRPMLAR